MKQKLPDYKCAAAMELLRSSFDYASLDTILLLSRFHIKTFSFTFDPTLFIQPIDKIP